LLVGRQAWLAAGALALSILRAETARATPAALFGAGPRSIALAGGGTSLPLGPESVLTNPAELALVPVTTLTIGLQASDTSLSYDALGTRHPYPTELNKGLTIGVAAPLFRPKPGGWSAALGLFAETPPDFLVRAHLPLAEEPSFPLMVERQGALNLGVGLGVGYGPFSLGAGVEVLATLSGRDVVAGASGAASGVSDELLPAFGPSVGASADFGSGGRLGVAFRSVLRADFDVNVAATSLAGLVGIVPLNVQGIAHYEPLKVDAEYSRDFGPYDLVVGVRYEHWSAFPGWVSETVDCPPGVPCGTAPPPPADYSDVVSPRIGLERTFDARALSITARLGYSFVPAAIPEQRGSSNTFDADRHALGIGYRIHLTRSLPLDLDGAWRFDFLADRAHHKDAVPPGPLGPEVTTHGKILTWSFAVRMEL
jgi:hypothetical protein